MTYSYGMVPVAGTANGFGISKITSGFPIRQPLAKTIGFGPLFGSPAGVPDSAQAASVAMSASLSLRSFANLPTFGSANQGGIFFVTTAWRIALAQGRA